MIDLSDCLLLFQLFPVNLMFSLVYKSDKTGAEHKPNDVGEYDIINVPVDTELHDERIYHSWRNWKYLYDADEAHLVFLR